MEEGEGGRGQGRWSDGRVSGPLTPEFAFFLPRSAAFHNFVKVTLTKSPKKRPSATKMLTVSLPPLRSLPKRTARVRNSPGPPTALYNVDLFISRNPHGPFKVASPSEFPRTLKTLPTASQAPFLFFLGCAGSSLQCAGFSGGGAQAAGHKGLVVVALWLVGSFHTRDRTCVPCIGRQILNHWTASKVPNTEFLNLTNS